MKQIDNLKTVIYQIIGENQFLLDTFDCVRRKGNWNNIEIDIVYYRDCAGSSRNGKIIIGIPDIVDLYKLSLKYSNHISNCDDFFFRNKIFRFWGE